VRELARSIVAAAAGSTDDPFRVARLSDESLAADPALLADEARALSMTGGRRAVWVSRAGGGLERALELYLADPGGEALIVAEAGSLAKTSRLRQLAEKASEVAAIACYEDTPEDLRRLVLASARRDRLEIQEDALELLLDLLGSDRAASRGEIEKLLLYCRGRDKVLADDVLAACGDASAASLEALADAVLEGELAEAVGLFDRLVAGGLSPVGLLSAFQASLSRLLALRYEIDAGRDRDAVLRAARPPIFFQRLSRISRQLALWNREALMGAARTISFAIEQTRDHSALESSLAERAFISLARKSQALRSRTA
jgi:DNA polymerase-3 subunit delta